jgi:hypothetical protein
MRASLLPLIFLVTTMAGCASRLPELPPSMIDMPAAADVESVIFLFGDAGYADETRDPVIRRLMDDVEFWAGGVGRDSAVAVLFLGDIVYPDGLRHAPEYFARDSAIAQSQVNILAGPAARQKAAVGYFLAGNHDWGNAKSVEGVRRLQNLEEFLDRRRAEGVRVELQPAAGLPGPAVVDMGSHTRLLLLDTAWWLLADADSLKVASGLATAAAIREAGNRSVIMASHHPFTSAGPHGGLVPFWRTLGVRTLMHRAGAILQDLNSNAYRELLNAMQLAFAEGRPLVWGAGHDHNLQVIVGDTTPSPYYSLVSGSGSKLTGVGHAEGMRYRRMAPGYMKLITHRTGRVDLFVVAAPDEDHLRCEGDGEELVQCMTRSVAAIQPTYGMRLR